MGSCSKQSQNWLYSLWFCINSDRIDWIHFENSSMEAYCRHFEFMQNDWVGVPNLSCGLAIAPQLRQLNLILTLSWIWKFGKPFPKTSYSIMINIDRYQQYKMIFKIWNIVPSPRNEIKQSFSWQSWVFIRSLNYKIRLGSSNIAFASCMSSESNMGGYYYLEILNCWQDHLKS